MKLDRLLFALCLFLTTTKAMALTSLPECIFDRPTDVASLKIVTAKVKAECIPKIAKVHSCLVRTRLLIDQANELSNTFILGDQSKPLMVDEAIKGSFDVRKVDLSLMRNFLALEVDYQRTLDEIQKFTVSYRNRAGSRADIQDFIAELDRGYNKNSVSLAALTKRETALLFYMEKVLEELEKSADANRPEVQWVLSDKCKEAKLELVLAQLRAGIDDTLSKVDQIHTAAVRAKSARELLAQYSYMAVRESLLNRYRNQAIAELGALDGKIDTILEVSRLMDRFEHWVGRVASDSNRTKTIVVYLQFEGAQRIHASDLMTARGFKEKILAASESHPEVAQGYLARLDGVIANFESNLSRLKARGWQGHLSKQILLADGMLQIAHKYPAACVSRLKTYQESAKAVRNMESFRINERSFKETIKACEVTK